MKKSSRDYRRNNRKKWLKINSQYAKVALSTAMGIQSIFIIKNDIVLTKEQKALSIAEILIKTAVNISSSLK